MLKLSIKTHSGYKDCGIARVSSSGFGLRVELKAVMSSYA